MDEHNQLRKFQDTNALQIRESVIPAALNVDLAKDLDTYKREEYKNSVILPFITSYRKYAALNLTK